MADVLFQNLPSQSVVAPSHEVLLDNGSVTGRATVSKLIDLFNNSGSINTLTSSGSINIKSNSDSSGGGDINFLVGNNVLNNKIKSNAGGTQGLFEVIETHISSSFLSASANSVGIGAKENQLYRIDDAGKTGQLICADDWGEPKGGYMFDGVNDYISVPNNSNLNFGIGDFSLSWCGIVNNPTSGSQHLAGKRGIGSNWYRIVLYSTSGKPTLEVNTTTRLQANTVLQANTLYHIVVTRINGIAYIYINGKLDISGSLTSDVSNTDTFTIGAYSSSNYFNGKTFFARVYNRGLSTSEILSLYNNGLTGQNVLPIADVGANNDNMIGSTWLAVGNVSELGSVITYSPDGITFTYIRNSFAISGKNKKKYKLTYSIVSNTLIGNGVFSLMGKALSAGNSLYNGNNLPLNTSIGFHAIEFTSGDQNTLTQEGFQLSAGYTSGNLVVDSISITQIGCVAEYLPENAGRIGWIETMNGLHGSTSGSPICLTAEQSSQVYKDYKSTVTGNTTLTSIIPKRYILKQIIIENTTANTFTLNIGSSTSGGTDIVNGASIVSGLTTITINKTFSLTADQTLYLQSSNWNSSSNNFYFIMEKI